VTRSAKPRIHRFRPATRAILWYPLAALLAAGGFWWWAWSDCSPSRDPQTCRADIPEAASWFFLTVLAIGLAILALVWVLSALLGRGLGRRAVGFDAPASSAAGPGEAPAEAGGDRPVAARRSQRH